MKVLEAARRARARFNRDAWLGYHGNGWRTNRADWRKIVLLTQRMFTEEESRGS